MSELRLVWRYRLGPDQLAEFERMYGAEGGWATLFRRSGDFIGTELHRDVEDGTRYLVVDRWRSAGAHERFMESFGAEYAALSAETARLYVDEERIGSFERL